MFSDARFEIEKNRGNWRITVTGAPALGMSVGIGIILALAVVAWISKHPIL